MASERASRQNIDIRHSSASLFDSLSHARQVLIPSCASPSFLSIRIALCRALHSATRYSPIAIRILLSSLAAAGPEEKKKMFNDKIEIRRSLKHIIRIPLRATSQHWMNPVESDRMPGGGDSTETVETEKCIVIDLLAEEERDDGGGLRRMRSQREDEKA